MSLQECVVRKELRKNAVLNEFFKTTYDTGPLDPRCGFFGVRVHHTRMYYKPTPEEFDIVSLYPFV